MDLGGLGWGVELVGAARGRQQQAANGLGGTVAAATLLRRLRAGRLSIRNAVRGACMQHGAYLAPTRTRAICIRHASQIGAVPWHLCQCQPQPLPTWRLAQAAAACRRRWLLADGGSGNGSDGASGWRSLRGLRCGEEDETLGLTSCTDDSHCDGDRLTRPTVLIGRWIGLHAARHINN